MLKSIVKNNIVKYTAEQQIKINKANLNMINWNLIKKETRDIFKDQYTKDLKIIGLCDEFYNKTRHFDNDSKIDITPLLDSHNVSSPELLFNLYSPLYKDFYDKSPKETRGNYNNKLISEFDCDDISGNVISAADILEQNKYIIKNIYDIPLNIKFRQNPEDKQIINLDEFDAIHGEGTTYKLLLRMLNSKNIFSGYNSIHNLCTIERINKICTKINPTKALFLQDEFINNTTHTEADTSINITNFMKKYNITWSEFICYMRKNYDSVDKVSNENEKNETIASIEMEQGTIILVYYYIDFNRGFAAIHDVEQKTSNVKKFNNSNNKNFYYCIISLLNDKITN